MQWRGALRVGCATLLCTWGSACLVTDKPKFGEANAPASLRPISPRQSLLRAPLTPNPLCAADRNFMAFEVEILDANISDVLNARLYINRVYIVGREIPPTGEISRGPLRLCAPQRELLSSCNHVVLVVANAFGGEFEYEVRVESDLAKVEWWVLPPADEDPMAVTDNCERLFDGGVL